MNGYKLEGGALLVPARLTLPDGGSGDGWRVVLPNDPDAAVWLKWAREPAPAGLQALADRMLAEARSGP